MIILPGDPDFDWTLSTSIPPNWREVADQLGHDCALVAEVGSGLLRPVSTAELFDYLFGGEYDERMQEIGDEELIEYW